MKYMKPSIQVEETQTTNLLAESLNISDTPVNGSEALVKEDTAWDIWAE